MDGINKVNRINEHNKSPISVREGKVFIDGVEVMDSVKCTIKFTHETWEGAQLGERTKSRRHLGYSVTGSITQRRATSWLKQTIKKYIQTNRTPEFTVQGIMDDRNSDYYGANGSDVVTAVGCVLTGDLILTQLDRDGMILDEEITFGAKDVVL
jgi:hypothetical protein